MINNNIFFIGKPSVSKEKEFEYSYDWLHLLETYRGFVNKNMTVLDIGSSSLAKAKDLSPYCRKLVGLELMEERLLDSFSNAEFVKGNWQDLSSYFPENSFDIILSSHVIEHVPDDIKAFNEAYKVLKKGGRLLISTPNRKRLARCVIELFKGERKFPYWEHEREYIRNDLVKLIEGSSFSGCSYNLSGVTVGLHGGPFWFYLKKCPRFLERCAGFWELAIKK